MHSIRRDRGVAFGDSRVTMVMSLQALASAHSLFKSNSSMR
jgi:hypothetical protein